MELSLTLTGGKITLRRGQGGNRATEEGGEKKNKCGEHYVCVQKPVL